MEPVSMSDVAVIVSTCSLGFVYHVCMMSTRCNTEAGVTRGTCNTEGWVWMYAALAVELADACVYQQPVVQTL